MASANPGPRSKKVILTAIISEEIYRPWANYFQGKGGRALAAIVAPEDSSHAEG
jgi:hypothetical protein